MSNVSFPDRLADAVRSRGPLCVGLDPRWESLPDAYRLDDSLEGKAAAFSQFCIRVLELVRPYSGIVKPQSAFFEVCGAAGMKAQGEVLTVAKAMGFVTILDAKRGDISTTAAAYAHAAFASTVWNADSLTVNPYLGEDAIEPFVAEARGNKRGLFVLVRTSNPGGGLFQNLPCEDRPLYRYVADAVERWGSAGLGECGLSDVGAVVGATNPMELAELRKAYTAMWFLVPGYGAQGGTAKDCHAAYLPNGLGAVISSSRGVVFPFKHNDPAWESRVVEAAAKAQAELSISSSQN